MLIDTHCHLNFQAFSKDLDDVVRRSQKAEVEKIIIPGTDLTSSKRAVEIAKTCANCFAAVGIHPHHAKDQNLVINEDLRHRLYQLLTQPKVVAAGEIGLDYHVYKSSKYTANEITDEYKEKQKKLLTLQLTLAHELNKPVIFHCRDAHDDMIQTISAFTKTLAGTPTISRKKVNLTSEGGRQARSARHDSSEVEKVISSVKPIRGVFHCFGGSTHQLQLITTMGYYVGFDGNITYSQDWGKIVAAAPLERIVLETDAPYLAPVPHRGSRNSPEYLPSVAQAVADYHHQPVSEVIHLSTKNAKDLFGFSSVDMV